MAIALLLRTLWSIYLKILLDKTIDDYLRNNNHKSLAKKRKIRCNFTHSDIKHLIPKRYLLFNYGIYCHWLLIAALTVVSFFVSEETTELFRYGTCGAILAEYLIAVIHRVYELLSGKSTKIWHKVLLVICIVLILLLVLIK